MDLMEILDRLNEAAGSTEYGQVRRAINSNANKYFEESKRRNMQRDIARAEERERIKQSQFLIGIHVMFNSNHLLPLQLFTINNNDKTSGEHEITIFDENNFNGINMVWRCDPEQDEVRNIFYKITSKKKIDIAWNDFRANLLDKIVKDDIWKLCKNGIHVKTRDENKKIDLKSSDIYNMKHQIIVNLFRNSYVKCYNADNGIKDGCFITTAICEYFGKSDDCRELTTLRNYRDKWLKNQPYGQKLIDEYYKIAPSIVYEMKNSDNYNEICEELLTKYVNPCIELINKKKFDECKNLYIEMVNYAKSITDKKIIAA
ncbi:MAG: hypothetical protein IJ728_12175 [Selenomonadaceae bacterium]|nr:hypothetical protein [Selenomonadaceae bacterium]